MVIGHHLTWTAYGCWLPNDPRGSRSREVRVEALAELGEIHYGRKAVQPRRAEIREFHRQAKEVLAHPVLCFWDDEAIAYLAACFGQTIRERGYTCYACAIMPDHVHFLIRRHRDKAEAMIKALQDDSRALLIADGHRPADHPVWAEGGHKVFKDTRRAMWHTIDYIEGNVRKACRPEQRWDFVTPYDDWPPGANQ